jgi:hypothetical protein
MNDQRSTFQTAIAVVEALPVEEQTMLVKTIALSHQAFVPGQALEISHYQETQSCSTLAVSFCLKYSAFNQFIDIVVGDSPMNLVKAAK